MCPEEGRGMQAFHLAAALSAYLDSFFRDSSNMFVLRYPLTPELTCQEFFREAEPVRERQR